MIPERYLQIQSAAKRPEDETRLPIVELSCLRNASAEIAVDLSRFPFGTTEPSAEIPIDEQISLNS